MAIEEDRKGVNPNTAQALREAITELSSALPKVPELDANEQIMITVGDLQKLTDCIRQIERLVAKLHPQDSDQSLLITEVEGTKLNRTIVQVLSNKGIDTCEELSKFGVFDLIRIEIPGNFINKIKLFLKDNGYNYPGCELNDYDRSQFEKSSVTPEEILPLYEKSENSRQHNTVFQRLINTGIQTYGELTSCTIEDLLKIDSMGENRVQYIEEFIGNLGLKLKS